MDIDTTSTASHDFSTDAMERARRRALRAFDRQRNLRRSSALAMVIGLGGAGVYVGQRPHRTESVTIIPAAPTSSTMSSPATSAVLSAVGPYPCGTTAPQASTVGLSVTLAADSHLPIGSATGTVGQVTVTNNGSVPVVLDETNGAALYALAPSGQLATMTPAGDLGYQPRTLLPGQSASIPAIAPSLPCDFSSDDRLAPGVYRIEPVVRVILNATQDSITTSQRSQLIGGPSVVVQLG